MSGWWVYGVPLIAVTAAIVGNIILYAASRAFDKKWNPPHAGE